MDKVLRKVGNVTIMDGRFASRVNYFNMALLNSPEHSVELCKQALDRVKNAGSDTFWNDYHKYLNDLYFSLNKEAQENESLSEKEVAYASIRVMLGTENEIVARCARALGKAMYGKVTNKDNMLPGTNSIFEELYEGIKSKEKYVPGYGPVIYSYSSLKHLNGQDLEERLVTYNYDKLLKRVRVGGIKNG